MEATPKNDYKTTAKMVKASRLYQKRSPANRTDDRSQHVTRCNFAATPTPRIPKPTAAKLVYLFYGEDVHLQPHSLYLQPQLPPLARAILPARRHRMRHGLLARPALAQGRHSVLAVLLPTVKAASFARGYAAVQAAAGPVDSTGLGGRVGGGGGPGFFGGAE